MQGFRGDRSFGRSTRRRDNEFGAGDFYALSDRSFERVTGNGSLIDLVSVGE